MRRAEIEVRTWAGQEKRIQQAKLEAERDRDGRIFYKITGFRSKTSGETERFMIGYSYEKGTMLQAYSELMERLLAAQEAIWQTG